MEITWSVQRVDVGGSGDVTLTFVDAGAEVSFRVEAWAVKVLMEHLSIKTPNALARWSFSSSRRTASAAVNLAVVEAWHRQNGTRYVPPTAKQIMTTIALAISMRRPPTLFMIDEETLRRCLTELLSQKDWANNLARLVHHLSDKKLRLMVVTATEAGMASAPERYYFKLMEAEAQDVYFYFGPSANPITFKKSPPTAING